MRCFIRGMLLHAAALIAFASPALSQTSYLDQNGGEVYGEIYKKLGIELNERVAHDPQVWMTLDRLKRENCDQKAIVDLATLLDKLGYPREAAMSQYNFVKACGAPVQALQKSVDLLLKLSDHAMALEVADELVRRAPAIGNPRYLRAVALQGLGDYSRAIADYAEAIELFSNDRSRIGSHVFTRMAESYARLGRFCEATTPILTWIAIDPVRRDTERMRKIVADFEVKGNCATQKADIKERFAQRGGSGVATAPVTINGVRGVFVIDTGASFVSIKKAFADKAKIAYADGGRITLHTANGTSPGRLTKADGVKLGQLDARQVPVVVQEDESGNYGPGVDGLLGMSFLSRFDVQVKGGFVEVATRTRK